MGVGLNPHPFLSTSFESFSRLFPGSRTSFSFQIFYKSLLSQSLPPRQGDGILFFRQIHILISSQSIPFFTLTYKFHLKYWRWVPSVNRAIFVQNNLPERVCFFRIFSVERENINSIWNLPPGSRLCRTGKNVLYAGKHIPFVIGCGRYFYPSHI